MATITPQTLSNSTNARGIKVVATSTPGTAVHLTSAVAGVLDEVWLYAENTDSVTRTVTIEYGGTTAPGDTITQAIPAGQGLFLLVPGIRLGGAGALQINAFASAANVVCVFGNVNRYA